MTDLRFSEAASNSTTLLFGAADFVIPSRQVNIAATLGGVTVAAFLGAPVKVNADITLGGVMVQASVLMPVSVFAEVTLGGVSVSAAVFYDNRVTPWRDVRAAAWHQPAASGRATVATPWVGSAPKRGGVPATWQSAKHTMAQPAIPTFIAVSKVETRTALNALGDQRGQGAASVHQKASDIAAAAFSRWTLGQDRRIASTVRNQAGIFKLQPRLTYWQTGARAQLHFDAPAGASLWHSGAQALHGLWRSAGAAVAGKSDLFPVVVLPPVLHVDTHLLFACPPLEFPNLVFGSQQCYLVPVSDAPFYILPARFYMTAHTIFAERLPDLADVPIFEATVSADAGSYCWSLQASGPASLFAQLAPVDGLPVQLRLWLDGLPFVFAIDAISRAGSFGKTGVNISGRSVTALIGAPYLRATTRGNAGGAMLAQQLALDALQYSGVDLDWGVASGALANGGMADWLVPAGAWSHQGTPLDAVQAISQAAGGYLQSHRSAAMLLARHPYGQRAGDNPGAPWGWMTGPADVELAPDAIITEGLERKDGPDLNAVYVSGTTQGVLAQVKRTASAGDKLAQMVTDPLITHVDAARQRGLAILGAAGSKYHVRLDLPVLTGAGQPGVLDVGQLVQVNASTPWRGRVRAVSATYKRPSLRQSVTLERHLETV